MIAVLTYPYQGSTRIGTVLLLALVFALAFAWERATTRAYRLRLIGLAAIALVGIAATAHAGPPVIGNPCTTCQALWPEWMCWLDCFLY